MSWIARFRIKNALIIANFISNAIGVTVVNLLAQMSNPAIPERLSRALERCTRWLSDGPASPILSPFQGRIHDEGNLRIFF